MIKLKKRKIKINFFYDGEGVFSFEKILPILGQYNIRDTSSILKIFLEDIPFKFFKKPLRKIRFSFLFQIFFFFNNYEDTIIRLRFPNLNYFIKNLVFKKRKKEIFLRFEIFKLLLVSSSNYFFNQGGQFSFLFFSKNIGALLGLNLSFKNYFFFNSRKINFRRKNKEQ
jgi:hypothetical protein